MIPRLLSWGLMAVGRCWGFIGLGVRRGRLRAASALKVISSPQQVKACGLRVIIPEEARLCHRRDWG